MDGLGACGAQLVVGLAVDQSSDRSPSLQRIMQDSGHSFNMGTDIIVIRISIFDGDQAACLEQLGKVYSQQC